MSSASLTAAVKSMAREEGFARVGVVSADVSFDESAYRAWLSAGRHGEMAYLAHSAAKRHAPGRLVEGARSIICLAVSYAPGESNASDAIIARYARGRDYHKVLKRRCRRLMDRMRAIEPTFAGRAFVDTAPIAERRLAAAAGLGWIGRNGCLIAGELGSYVLLCEIICNLPLSPDQPCQRDCGDCRLCIDACPTGAIVADGVVDARLCRSYLTIEHHGRIDLALWPKIGLCVFGCDACQAACPHNESVPAGDKELTCRKSVEGRDGPTARLTIADVLGWSESDWDAATRGSAMRRATHDMFVRNAVLAAGNSGDGALIDPLSALQARRADLAEEIAWAIGRIHSR